MMINPFWKNGETHKLTYKKMVAKGFPAKNASYCIPSFTLELKIQTYLFFAAETWFFDIPPPAFNKRFFFQIHETCAGDFFVTQNTNSFVFICRIYLSPAPSIPVSFGIPVILKHVSFMSSWVVPNGTSPTRKDMLFGLWFRSPWWNLKKRDTEGRQDMAERYILYVYIYISIDTLFI